PDGPLTAWAHGDHPAARALAASYGFALTRELLLLRRPAAALEPSSRTEPGAGGDGIVFRTFRPGDEEACLALTAPASAAHPEPGDLDLAGLRARMAEPWFDPAGFFLAERDGRLLGFHWTKVHADGAFPGAGE